MDDEWIIYHGWMDRWMDGGWMDDEWMMNGSQIMDGWKDGWMMDGWMDRWMDD